MANHAGWAARDGSVTYSEQEQRDEANGHDAAEDEEDEERVMIREVLRVGDLNIDTEIKITSHTYSMRV